MTDHRVLAPATVRPLLAAAASILAGRPAYLVGGSVRDILLGRAPTDLDLAASGGAPAVARELADKLGGHFVLLDAERGTARIVLDDGPVRVIDIAVLRGDIEADLAQRDFTIDALAAPLPDIADGSSTPIIDSTGGLRDLERGLIRLVSEQALLDDPLRLLRAVRLAVQLDFRLEPDTADAIRRRAAHITEAAPERRRDELARCFSTERAAPALRLLDELALFDPLFPEVAAGRGVTQPKEHHWDVLEHSIETVAALDFMLASDAPETEREGSFWRALWEALDFLPELRQHFDEQVGERRTRGSLIKLAGLLHDVAKPETRAPDATGRIRFFGHAERGAEKAAAILRRLRFSRREVALVTTMVEEHLRPGQLGQGEPPSRRALFRFYRDTGDAAESVLLLSLADHLAARGPGLDLDGWRRHVAYIAHVFARRDEDDAIARPVRLLNGNDLMSALGMRPGPEVGRLLAELEEALGSGEISNREEAWSFVRRRQRPQAKSGLASMRPNGVRAVAAAGGRR